MSLIVRHPKATARLFGLVLAAAIYGIDQWLKWFMRVELKLDQRGVIDLLPFFDLRWTANYGISLGLLTAESMEMRWLLVALTSGIAAIVFIWICREKRLGDIFPLGLVLGGAMGNIRDRYIFGFVIDYADLHFGEFRPFLIFNLADAAITIGVLIILARSFLSREKQPKTPNDTAEPATES